VKNASLITGVSYEYYRPVLERNFKNRQWIDPNDQPTAKGQKPKAKSHPEFIEGQQPNVTLSLSKGKSQKPLFHTAFPYGFDPGDYEIVLEGLETPWNDEVSVKPWVYAGAFLPNSRLFVELLFESIAVLQKEGIWNKQIRLYFIGTGAYPGKSIQEYADDARLSCVKEDRSRFPFLHVLNLLSAADTVMVVGSTEKHYTASKVYQAILSKRPVWSIFHQESSAVKVLEECEADQYTVRYTEELSREQLKALIKTSLTDRINGSRWEPKYEALEKYSAKESAAFLLRAIEKITHLSS
jgi:hypothetical protein